MDEKTKRDVKAGKKTILKVKTDSDWAGDLEERKSTTCALVTWGGVMLHSHARTQKPRGLSSPEAELLLQSPTEAVNFSSNRSKTRLNV